MSHDCDCDSCQENDSRWAPHRATQKALKALKDDCPRGVHVAELWRASSVDAFPAEYRCKHCDIQVDAKGRTVKTMVEEAIEMNRKFNIFQTHAESAEEIRTMSEANAKLLLATAPVCKDHKRYQAKRKPRASCEVCWRRYVHLNPR